MWDAQLSSLGWLLSLRGEVILVGLAWKWGWICSRSHHGFVGVSSSLELNSAKGIRRAELRVLADGPLLRQAVIFGQALRLIILSGGDARGQAHVLTYQTTTAAPGQEVTVQWQTNSRDTMLDKCGSGASAGTNKRRWDRFLRPAVNDCFWVSPELCPLFILCSLSPSKDTQSYFLQSYLNVLDIPFGSAAEG